MKEKIVLYDSTLRDGQQGEGISVTVEDKLNILRVLDDLGVDYIEGGNPASNPKDREFFMRAGMFTLQHSKLVAFGSTHKKGCAVQDDAGMQALLDANTQCVAIVGKCHSRQVQEVLGAAEEENLSMIEQSIRYLCSKGKEVIFDAEHFFDGYKLDASYAMDCIRTARNAGASWIVLCDTNGGCFYREIEKITKTVKKELGAKIGIHCHNDMDLAVANSIGAVKSGATQVQGTWLGVGERCGNANLASVAASLQLKDKYALLPKKSMKKLFAASHKIASILNLILPQNTPYVGDNAFTHKGGMHIDAIMKNPASFEHINPDSVGNKRDIVLSEVSGRSAVRAKIAAFDSDVARDSSLTKEVLAQVKTMENEGYQFESATATFYLIVKKCKREFLPPFETLFFKVSGERTKDDDEPISYAVVKIKVGDNTDMNAAEGNGPVHALDRALRKTLTEFYPFLAHVKLTDYRVRVVNPQGATASRVRVAIESSNGNETWTTMGVSEDVINASYIALKDSFQYAILKGQ